MVKISRLTDYGVMLLSLMAQNPDNTYTASELAEASSVALPTVSKLLKIMANKGLLTSFRGAHGGYKLAHLPKEINIAAIIEALEGQIALTECSEEGPMHCSLETCCPVRTPWQRINQILKNTLQNVYLADIITTAMEEDNYEQK